MKCNFVLLETLLLSLDIKGKLLVGKVWTWYRIWCLYACSVQRLQTFVSQLFAVTLKKSGRMLLINFA